MMLKKRFLILIGILNILIVSSQTDTITYAECEIDTVDTGYDKLLKYFIIEKEEIKHLWKLNVVDWASLNPSIAYEQKLFYLFTVEFEAKIKIEDNYDFSLPSKHINYQGILNVEPRLYFTKNRRERMGRPTNGFSGSYLFTVVGITLDSKIYENFNSNRNFSNNRKTDIGFVGAYGLGYQRRIGNVAYIDFRAGFTWNYIKNYNYSQAGIPMDDGYYFENFGFPFFDINMGFALKSLKRPLFK